jgi:tetratricopeptide (TPR) repeat protein
MKPSPLRAALGLAAMAAVALPAAAQQPKAAPAARADAGAAAPRVVSSHQIDRFEAINQLQQSLKSDPDNKADWIILGELAQEVATDVPADQADRYYKMAQDAYEHALKLDPNNAGLKAAVQFAKDQQSGAAQFNRSRQQATSAYLDARRRELAAANAVPTVRVFTTAGPMPAVDPITGGVRPGAVVGQPATAASAPVEAAPAATTTTTTAAVAPPVYQGYPYGYGIYQPFLSGGQPYTYSQYANSYFPDYAQNPPANPITVRQYTQQLPRTLAAPAARTVEPGAINAVGRPR